MSNNESTSTCSIILFYKYHPLALALSSQSNGDGDGDGDEVLTEMYRLALENLCKSLNLNGRILVASSEGINGTLAGSKEHVEAFTYALLGVDYHLKEITPQQQQHYLQPILQTFWKDCRAYTDLAQVPLLTMTSPDDFKWSTSSKLQNELFPDLNIKLVTELIGTGGLFSDISVEETAKGYLTPREWHDALQSRQAANNADDSILIDCRNTKECQIGHFEQAVDPNTTVFCQFPKWVRDNEASLRNKKVFMYCTGGIRCEKASAYIRKVIPQVKEVQHLQGGIHKYLEEFPSREDSLFKGKNFVFDGRAAAATTTTDNGGDDAQDQQHEIVGQCVYCTKPYDLFLPKNVCTVCREPTLVCDDCCNSKRPEIHCRSHFHLRNCYFHDLRRFSADEIQDQLAELEQEHLAKICVGRKFKQKRKTLQKQCDKIRAYNNNDGGDNQTEAASKCRNCGDVDCNGACWGFHSLKRKERLEEGKDILLNGDKKARLTRPSSNQRQSKQSQRQRLEQEILRLGLKQPASTHRDPTTGLRVPPPCVRVIQTNVKGKWCGKSVLDVIQEEFADVANDLDNVLQHGLLRVNDSIVVRDNNTKLKNMDTIQRLVHWHEPPVLVPPEISVQKLQLPGAVVKEYNLDVDSTVFVCNKPSTVPVHPTGPYLANSLTIMVEAQEGLENLNPCHRLDRATSGLTICTPNVSVSRLIQGKMMEEGCVKKLYVAKVKGRFPSTEIKQDYDSGVEVILLDDSSGTIEVRAPIEVEDPFAGIRRVSKTGKPSTSRFRLCHYYEDEDTSLIVCHPITGRGHQLRVHLQALGHPIVDDILYGGDRVNAEQAHDHAIDGISRSIDAVGDDCTHSDTSISKQDAQSVKASCRCCNGGQEGIKASFSAAQLLGGGHSICLHALRYEIVFRSKKGANEILGALEMEVDLPLWAMPIETEKLSWLV